MKKTSKRLEKPNKFYAKVDEFIITINATGLW